MTAGSKISGTIRVNVKSPLAAKQQQQLIVATVLEEKTHCDFPAFEKSSRRFMFVLDTKWTSHEHIQQVPLPKAAGSNGAIQPGEYDIKVEAPIPSNAPTSGSWDKAYFDKDCRWQHCVRILIEEGKGKMKDIGKDRFRFVRPAPLPSPLVPGKILCPNKTGSGNISIGFLMEDTCTQPGGTLYLKAVICNRSDIPVQEVVFRILERKTWTTEPPNPDPRTHYVSDGMERYLVSK